MQEPVPALLAKKSSCRCRTLQGSNEEFEPSEEWSLAKRASCTHRFLQASNKEFEPSGEHSPPCEALLCLNSVTEAIC